MPDHVAFAAVFPKAVVAKLRNAKQFQRKQTLSVDSITSQLAHDARSCLGIGHEEANSQFARLTGFDPYFPNASSTSLAPRHEPAMIQRYCEEVARTRSHMYIPSWRADFGVARLEKLLAAVIDRLLTDFITWSYGGSYGNSAIDHLRIWVDRVFQPYLSCILSRLRGRSAASEHRVDSYQLQKWRDMAFIRLADLRVSELFEVVVDWDSTASAIDDLKSFTTNTATRSYLTGDFSTVLSRRLLHPGASTIEILQVYISIIKAFRRLDAKGVLLEKVARKVRRYLREREDTVRIVVAGLLADVPDSSSDHDPDVLSELAAELQQRAPNDNRGSDGDLDWNNMEWIPDPIDAAPDYMKAKSTDVIGSLISLFDSKDVFVKELQIMLAERLLKNKTDFDQEIGVVEHLKIRFGDAALQGCEVMLRDVLDSRKVDQVIRQDQNMNNAVASEPGATLPDGPELHAKILSRLFWPSLQEQTFNVPPQIQEQQARYEEGFESLKQSRKLTWLNAIGQVEVHLELGDREVHEDVLPWQASVIYAFQDTPTNTIRSLQEHLAMTPALIRSACMFWAARRVLAETPGQRDTFHVLETLPTALQQLDDISGADGVAGSGAMTAGGASTAANAAAAAAAAEAAANQAAREADEQERKQKMAMFHQFIVSMLTNQGAMPLPRISMMLGIVVPGGFPFGNEELREFLSGMVKDGVLEIGAGGAYKVR